MTRREHIESLAARLGVQIKHTSDPLKVRANRGRDGLTPTVHVMDYDLPGGYATALHELGHVALGHIFSPAPFWGQQEMQEELDAWAWAQSQAREPLSQRIIDLGLDSHAGRLAWLTEAEARYVVQTAYDEANERASSALAA